MKKQRVYALSLIFVIFFNFMFVSYFFLLPQLTNRLNPEVIVNDPDPDLSFHVNSEDIFEMYANFKADFAPLQIVTFIGQNNISYDENFAYLAAIPIGLYNESNILKVSPILYDNPNYAQDYFLTDWKNYCNKFDSWDGIKNIIYIGNVSAETKNQSQEILNPEYTPIQFLGTDIYDITSQMATYFWYRPDTVVIAPINETFPTPQSTIINYSDTLGVNGLITRSGEINGTNLENFWSNSTVTLNSGGLFIEINNTDDLAMELFGNYSQPIPWMYDTNKVSKSNWVFFPNITYPASMTDWGLRVYNTTEVTSPIAYDLNFSILTYQTYQVEIDNSESRFDVILNWTNLTDDLNFWMIDPSGQLIGASSRTGNLYESGNTNKYSGILYPAIGNWTIIVTRTGGAAPVLYDLNINITKYSSYRRQCIESAANGAVIASALTKPLLYVTNSTIPNATKEALSTLNATRVICIDPFNLINESVLNELAGFMGGNVNLTMSVNLTSRSMLYNYIYNITQESDVVLSSVNEGYYAPASLLAAYHGAPVSFTLNESYNVHAGAIKNFAIDYWIGFQNPGDSALLNESIPRFEDMRELSDIFYSWMNSTNLNKDGNETVLVVSPLIELNPYFDRAIYGQAYVGRFAAQNTGDLALFVCRNILYPALSYVNLSYGYESQNKIAYSGGNATITGTQLFATNYTGDYTACQLDDGVYHTYYNDTDGQIVMAYFVNLTDSRILYNNISQVEIALGGKIGYANSSIQVAGWGIWNWIASSYTLINNSSLNSTGDNSDSVLITTVNKSNFVSQSNARIEILILVNTTGPPVNVSIDQLQFNVTYDQLVNNPLMTSSHISYYHNFTHQGRTYNFSTLIPLNFTQSEYMVANLTSYQQIYAQLSDNCKLWYYSGNSTLPESGFGQEGNLLFTTQNYWRSYGDYDDNQGATPENPDADGDHFVMTNTTLGTWQTGSIFNDSLPHLHSSFVLLQDGYVGATSIPEYLMLHGATTVIAGLKQNVLGYSEYFSYSLLNELLTNQPIGPALYTGLQETSHIYSQNVEGNILGLDPFSNYTEENQQFILFGDPELTLLNKTYDLPAPSNYRPLIHGFYNHTFRTTYNDPLFNFYRSYIYASITDVDSDIYTEYSVSFTVTDAQWHTYVEYEWFQTDQNMTIQLPPPGLVGYNFEGITKFHDSNWYQRALPPEAEGYKNFNFYISDSVNSIELNVPIYLRSGIPTIFIPNSTISINNNSIAHDPPDTPANDVMGRVNDTLSVRFCVLDYDQDYMSNPDQDELTVNLTLFNRDDNSTVFLQLEGETDTNGNDATSYWNITFSFNEFNTTGEYGVYALVIDGENEISDLFPYTPAIEYPLTAEDGLRGQFYQFFDLVNWLPEANGTNFVLTNGTSPTQQVFRENETLEVFTAVFDVDGNQTHAQNVSVCFYKATNQWINVTMSDSDLDNNWTTRYIFTKYNESGVWFPYIKVTDKDNGTILLNSNINITVANILPTPKGLNITDFNQTVISSVLRNVTIVLSANATDIDVVNRTTTLNLYACLRDPSGIVQYQELMTYDNGINGTNGTNLWRYNFTPQTTDAFGNWTFFVKAFDETGMHANSSELTLWILNNMPVMQTVNIDPASAEFFIGEPLSISGTAIDVEDLANISVFIEDDDQNRINLSQSFSGQSFDFAITFNEADYAPLKTTGTWNITIRLYDADGNFTGEFTFGADQNSVTIIVRPRYTDPGFPFPWEIIVIVAIVVTTILATYLVYRTRKKEATVVPAARVKQIIKKISKEKDEKISEARADIRARIKAIDIKPKPKITILPGKIEERSEEEKEIMNKQIQTLIQKAQVALENNLFEAASIAYHDAAKIATKLEKHEIAKVYLAKGEEILARKAELKKKAKKEAKEIKKMERKARVKLSRTEIENIKAEIGKIMSSARKALREDDYISAAKQYREVSELYRKIQDEDNAKYFEEKAEELL